MTYQVLGDENMVEAHQTKLVDLQCLLCELPPRRTLASQTKIGRNLLEPSTAIGGSSLGSSVGLSLVQPARLQHVRQVDHLGLFGIYKPAQFGDCTPARPGSCFLDLPPQNGQASGRGVALNVFICRSGRRHSGDMPELASESATRSAGLFVHPVSAGLIFSSHG
jgi:hypothetical protein